MKLLAYDDLCPMCVAKSATLVRWARAGERARAALSSFEGETAARLEAAGARNELAVLDDATGAVSTGYDAIVDFLASHRGGAWPRVLGLAPVRAIGRVGYRMIAYNRRVLAPPRGRVLCACDPDPRPRYNVALVVVLWVIALPGFAFALGPESAATLLAWFAALPAVYAVARVIVARGLGVVPGHLMWVVAAASAPFTVLFALEVVVARLHGGPGGGPSGGMEGVRSAVAALLAGVAIAFEVRRRLPHLRALAANSRAVS